ncbi:MAG: metallophosphoesterase [Abditibacteriota bacterium]|nr:metallophosphoesterase [Abditibacteriota bacterium]
MKLIAIFAVLLCSVAAVCKPFSFIQLSDPHMGWLAAIKRVELGAPESLDNTELKAAVKKINAMKPDFVYCSGDMVSFANHEGYVAKFKEAVKDLEMPLYCAAGNHDIIITENGLKHYYEDFGRDYYKFVYNNSLFLCVDTCATERYRNCDAYEKKQRRWLENNLEGSKTCGYDHIFVLCHVPFIARSFDEGESYSSVRPDLREKYLTLFKKYNVEFVLAGHLHWETDILYDGTRHIAVQSFVSDPNWNKLPKGFRLYKVYDDRVETEWLPLSDDPQEIML